MNIVIDQGNTQVKIAIFDGELLIEEAQFKALDQAILDSYRSKYDLNGCILSSVRQDDFVLLEFLESVFPLFINLCHTTPMPISLTYATPNTLGCDRIAACVGAESQEIAGQTALIIDAGTAITYDLLVSGSCFAGGNISPGIKMRLQALHTFTGKLPMVEAMGDTPAFGYSTETAIRSGVIQGVVHEIEGYIAEMKAENAEVLVFLTGGDSEMLANKLKYSIFVDSKLVLKGLNRILNYNDREK